MIYIFKRGFYLFLTIPFFAVGKIYYYFNLDNFRSDFQKVVISVESRRKDIPESFIQALIIAEDHRSTFHFGIDHIAMMRAVFVRVYKNEYEGASTIEQQFIRAVISRYERTFWRKFREQLLAVLVRETYSVQKISQTYLTIAFYGSGLEGINCFLSRKKKEVLNFNCLEVYMLIARLKYPEPLRYKVQEWEVRIANRVRYMKKRLNQIASKT